MPSWRKSTAPVMNLQWSLASHQSSVPTFSDFSQRYLDSLLGDDEARDTAQRDLSNHILPQFGHLRLDQVSEKDIAAWISEADQDSSSVSPEKERVKKLIARMWSLAVDLKLADAELNPLQGSLRFDRRGQGEELLSAEQAGELLACARSSQNRQLKYVLSLLMLTGARTGEILNVRWQHIDLAAGIWRVNVPGSHNMRELYLSSSAIALLARMPRFDNCDYVVPNPATRKPYRSLTQSWEVVKAKAGLTQLELDDLRYCHFGPQVWDDQLLKLVQEHERQGGSADESSDRKRRRA
jgi:integrase